jgi:uncharacterized membrane protein YdcZ (DUF606 family)
MWSFRELNCCSAILYSLCELYILSLSCCFCCTVHSQIVGQVLLIIVQCLQVVAISPHSMSQQARNWMYRVCLSTKYFFSRDMVVKTRQKC